MREPGLWFGIDAEQPLPTASTALQGRGSQGVRGGISLKSGGLIPGIGDQAAFRWKPCPDGLALSSLSPRVRGDRVGGRVLLSVHLLDQVAVIGKDNLALDLERGGEFAALLAERTVNEGKALDLLDPAQ